MIRSTPELSCILGSVQDAFPRAYPDNVRSRVGLLAQGTQIDVSRVARRMGFAVQVFIFRETFDRITKCRGSGTEGDLCDLMRALRQALDQSPRRCCPVIFEIGGLLVVAKSGPVDRDNPEWSITLAHVEFNS